MKYKPDKLKPGAQNQSMIEDDDGFSIPEPVNIGDLIVLKSNSGTYDGYLCGSQAEKHVAMQVSSKQLYPRDSLEFDSHTFRICPSLNYRHRHDMQSRSTIPIKPSTCSFTFECSS